MLVVEEKRGDEESCVSCYDSLFLYVHMDLTWAIALNNLTLKDHLNTFRLSPIDLLAISPLFQCITSQCLLKQTRCKKALTLTFSTPKISKWIISFNMNSK